MKYDLMKMAELKSLAYQKGITMPRTAKKEEYIQMLTEIDVTAQPDSRPKKEEKKERKIDPVLTEDEVIQAVKHVSGLKIRFDAHCWHMRKGVREDSGNMQMPVSMVKRCAERL